MCPWQQITVQQLDQKKRRLFKHQTINSLFHFIILGSQTLIIEYKCFILCQPKNTMDKPPSSFRLHLCDVFKRLFPSGNKKKWKHTLVVFCLTINTPTHNFLQRPCGLVIALLTPDQCEWHLEVLIFKKKSSLAPGGPSSHPSRPNDLHLTFN